MEAVGCLGKCGTQASAGVCSAALFEVWVLASLLSGDATSRIIDEHHFKEVETAIVKAGAERRMLVSLPFRE